MWCRGVGRRLSRNVRKRVSFFVVSEDGGRRRTGHRPETVAKIWFLLLLLIGFVEWGCGGGLRTSIEGGAKVFCSLLLLFLGRLRVERRSGRCVRGERAQADVRRITQEQMSNAQERGRCASSD